MEIPIWQVDAFTRRRFGGNPAAVCLTKEWLPETTMQAIAAENNLAETAFVVPGGAGYVIRWFTPTVEVALCGHATLASAYVLFEYAGHSAAAVEFDCKSGALRVTREADGRLCLDFPSIPMPRCQPHERLIDGLGVRPLEVLAAMDYMVVLESEDDVRSLQPDMAVLARLDRRGVIVTAKGGEADFVSRFFAPAAGIPEDPVTGSAHCALTPYWSRRLGKRAMRALQVSPRGGELWVEDRGDRVLIAGYAVPYLKGTITAG